MTQWLWAGSERTYGGQVTVGKLHLTEVGECDHGVFIRNDGDRWRTLCQRYAPKASTRGIYASGLHEAVPCLPCWRRYCELILSDIAEEVRP